MARAFITGLGGQDGSYLAEFLLEQGYEVRGLIWPARSLDETWLAPAARAAGGRLTAFHGDLRDRESLQRMLEGTQPDEVYHLAASSHVGSSFDDAEAMAEVNALGTLRLLEAVRRLRPAPKLFHASSAEIFGTPDHAPQDEHTPVNPVTPYGCAKAFATQMVAVYRRAHGLFAVNGIFYNHESPRRGEHFVTRKVCRAAAAIRLGLQQELLLGDLTAQRDWGDAREYVRGMWRALQHPTPEDFVFATGQLHSVQELVEAAFAALGLDWRRHVRHDPALVRPADPSRLIGCAAKARDLLGWQPVVPFPQLVREMAQADLERLQAAAPRPES